MLQMLERFPGVKRGLSTNMDASARHRIETCSIWIHVAGTASPPRSSSWSVLEVQSVQQLLELTGILPVRALETPIQFYGVSHARSSFSQSLGWGEARGEHRSSMAAGRLLCMQVQHEAREEALACRWRSSPETGREGPFFSWSLLNSLGTFFSSFLAPL